MAQQHTQLKHEIVNLKRRLAENHRILRDQAIQAEKERRHSEIMGILSHHIGLQNAIGMGELYTKVYKKEWKHRINDTRELRSGIGELQAGGRKICSTTDASRGGYYLPASDSEWNAYVGRYIMQRARGINKVRKIWKISVAEAMRQVQLVLEEDAV
jgi:hypothetical protein